MRRRRLQAQRHRSTKERFLARRVLHRRGDDEAERWYYRKHLILPMLAVGLAIFVFVLTFLSLRVADFVESRAPQIAAPVESVPEVSVGDDVVEGIETMDYDLAKDIFSGKVIGVTRTQEN